MKTEPPDIFHNGIDVFHIFFHGIGIVEPKVANAVVLFGNAEIEANRLGMADVKIAVGFGWKAGLNAASVFTFLQIFFHNLFDEIEISLRFFLVEIFCC